MDAKTVAPAALYTPCAIAGLEAVVQRIHRYYPRRSRAECRDILALLYGHESWMLLETAVLCAEPSAYDEDETPDRVYARREHQVAMARLHLAGCTESAAITAARVERDLAPAGALSISRRHDPYWRRQRIERARYAHDMLYAEQAIAEMRPTAREPLAIASDDPDLHLSVRIELLPRALVAWLEQQRPRLKALADRLALMRVRQRAQCDLLTFAFVWGEACVSHPADIPEALQIYPLVLCGKWYGWNACRDAPPGPRAAEARASVPSRPLAPPLCGFISRPAWTGTGTAVRQAAG